MSPIAFAVVSPRQGRYLLITAFCSILVLTGAESAQGTAPSAEPGAPSIVSAETGEDEAAEGIPVVTLESGRTVLLFPSGDLYPQYAADPHRVGFGLQYLSFTKTRIAESGDSRVDLRAGGRFGIVRVQPQDQPGRGWQLSIEGGFNAQFDIDYSLDNIGWDGKYGLLLTKAWDQDLSFKLGALHTSSHVGDEYEERTGRRRIGYTRHELAAGISRSIERRWRAYAEAGWGYRLSNENVQKPGRFQLGLEYEYAKSLWKGCAGWYAAVDVSSMEERDWRVDTSLQVGLMFRSGERIWRLGIERYDGRPPIGEFFQDTESYIALGLWLDV